MIKRFSFFFFIQAIFNAFIFLQHRSISHCQLSSTPYSDTSLYSFNESWGSSPQVALPFSISNLNNVEFPSFSLDVLKMKSNQNTSLNMGGLEIWITLASNMRKQIRTEKNLTSDMIYSLKANGFLNMTSEVRELINPTLSFVGSQFVMSALLLLTSPFIFFLCVLPRARRGKLSLRNVKYEMGPKSRLLCIGNFTLSMGISNTFSSIVTAFQAVIVFLGNLKPTVINFFNSATQFGDDTITNLTTISTFPNFILETKLIASQLSNTLVDVSEYFTYISSNASLLNLTFQYFSSNLTSLNNEIQWSLGNTSALNNQLTVPGSGETYQLIQPISNIPNPPSLPTFSASEFSELSSILITLRTLPNFQTLASTLDTMVSNIEKDVNSQLITTRHQFQAELGTILHNSNSSLLGTIEGAPFVSTIDNLIATMANDLQSITPIVQKSETARYYLHLSIELLCIFSFLVMGLALASRSKKPVSYCACSSLLFAILFFFFTGLYFLLALVWSEACQQFDPKAPMLTVSAIMGDNAPTKYAKVAISTANYCKQNYSLFEALEKSNFTSVFQGVETLNFSTLAMSALSGVNFTRLAEGAINIQPDQYFSLDTTLLSLQLAYVTQLNFNSSTIESWSLDASLFQPFSSLTASLDTFSSSVGPSSFTYGQLYSSDRKLNAVYDFKNRIVRVQALLSQANQTTNLCSQKTKELGQYARNVRVSLERVQALIELVLPRYSDLQSTVSSFMAETKNDFVHTKIPFAINSISAFVQSAQKQIGQDLSCHSISLSYYSLLNGFCITLLGGIDAIWLSFFVHAIFALVAITNFRFLREIIVQATPEKNHSKAKNQGESVVNKSIKSMAVDEV